MALENVSNVPEVCSGMVRLAPIALHIPNSPFPHRTFPPRRLGRLCGTSCHLTPPPPPPGEKSWIRP